MTFTNDELSLTGVPRAEELIFHPVEQNFMKVKFLQWLIFWLIVLLVLATLFFLIEKFQAPAWITSVSLAIGLLAGFHLIVLRKSVAFKGYTLREHDLVYRTGWLVRSVKIVPYSRIQHCSVDEGVLARRYGLAAIRLFTSGGNEADIRVPGLKAAFAADLRELIITKIRQHGSTV